jgi:hypothetical protein
VLTRLAYDLDRSLSEVRNGITRVQQEHAARKSPPAGAEPKAQAA